MWLLAWIAPLLSDVPGRDVARTPGTWAAATAVSTDYFENLSPVAFQLGHTADCLAFNQSTSVASAVYVAAALCTRVHR